MKKILILLSFIFLLNGCAESVALLGGTAGGVSSGKMVESSLNSAVNYGIKKQTGKTAIGHAMAYAKKINPEEKKEPCVSFIEKTNSKICMIVKKQISLTKVKFKDKIAPDDQLKELTSSLQPTIDKKSKIKYLDR